MHAEIVNCRGIKLFVVIHKSSVQRFDFLIYIFREKKINQKCQFFVFSREFSVIDN